MINLLPPEVKREYLYARRNVHLVRWSAAFVLGIVGLMAITGFGWLAMSSSMSTYQADIATNKSQLEKDNSAAVEKQVTTISGNLKLMVKVLSNEILFSKLLDQLGTITPPNVKLTTLSIAQNQAAVEITAQTADYGAATQLQVNLADPNNKIFAKADIVNISCLSADKAADASYPCTADIRAQFTKNNPFLFINAKAPGTSK